MAELNDCSVGVNMKDPCHKLSFCRKTGFKKINSIVAEKKEILLWRSGLSILNVNADTCVHHEQLLTNKYSKLQNITVTFSNFTRKTSKARWTLV